MESINPDDIEDIDKSQISIITLKNGNMISIDETVPSKKANKKTQKDNNKEYQISQKLINFTIISKVKNSNFNAINKICKNTNFYFVKTDNKDKKENEKKSNNNSIVNNNDNNNNNSKNNNSKGVIKNNNDNINNNISINSNNNRLRGKKRDFLKEESQDKKKEKEEDKDKDKDFMIDNFNDFEKNNKDEKEIEKINEIENDIDSKNEYKKIINEFDSNKKSRIILEARIQNINMLLNSHAKRNDDSDLSAKFNSLVDNFRKRKKHENNDYDNKRYYDIHKENCGLYDSPLKSFYASSYNTKRNNLISSYNARKKDFHWRNKNLIGININDKIFKKNSSIGPKNYKNIYLDPQIFLSNNNI